jgi:SAM-dependent methyltransferase
MLASADFVRSLLVCPRCRGALQNLRCTAAAYELSRRAFPAVDGQPVLVDFEHSILSEDELLAPKVSIRPTLLGRFLGAATRLVSGADRVETHVIPRLQQLLAQLGNPVLLNVGGGTVPKPIAPLYADRNTRVIGFDIFPSSQTQFVADAHQIPLADGSVDAVLIMAVLEHVLEPWRVAEEIHRVLKPNGLVLAATPFLQHVHLGPYDFTRFTESGHRYLFKRFERLDSGVVGGPGTECLDSIVHLARAVTRSRKVGTLARLAFLWLMLLDRFAPEAYATDSASAFFFFGKKAEEAVTPRSMAGYYRGAM